MCIIPLTGEKTMKKAGESLTDSRLLVVVCGLERVVDVGVRRVVKPRDLLDYAKYDDGGEIVRGKDGLPVLTGLEDGVSDREKVLCAISKKRRFKRIDISRASGVSLRVVKAMFPELIREDIIKVVVDDKARQVYGKVRGKDVYNAARGKTIAVLGE